MFGRRLNAVMGCIALGVIALLAYLLIAPPALLRVGTNYAAKMVCSNHFIAGRDAEQVLALDVQAPGHPLLKYVSVKVDDNAQMVSAHLFTFFAPATAAYREGLGCTNIHDAKLSTSTLPPVPPLPDALWPVGNQVAPSQDPDILAVLSDEALLGSGYRATVVIKDGRIIGEAYAPGFDANTPLLGWSMTKTVTAGVIGTLIQSGHLSLSDPLTDSFPEWASDGRQNIRLQDMLAMTSGLQWNEGYGNVSDVTRMLYLVDDMSTFASQLPLETTAGSHFNYSSGTSTMLSRLWQDKVGDDSLTYPRRALFDPLGMTSAILETDAKDTVIGSSYMYATARDWGRYGLFLLQEGEWNGTKLLPTGFTDWMFKPVAASDGIYAHGHLWRTATRDAPTFGDSVWLRGHDGQTVGIFPSENMVIVRMGLTPSRTGYSALPLAKAMIAAVQP